MTIFEQMTTVDIIIINCLLIFIILTVMLPTFIDFFKHEKEKGNNNDN